VRHAHVNIPDFSDVQRSSSGKASEDGDFTRRAFTYSIVAGGTVIGAHAAKNILQDFLMTMSASVSYLLFYVNVTRFQLFFLVLFVRTCFSSCLSCFQQADVLALAKIEVDLTSIPEGNVFRCPVLFADPL
jgi:hypothetical protein